jgi:hypothetical protein
LRTHQQKLVLPRMLLIFGGGRWWISRLAQVVGEYSAAATIAEVLSSIRTAQAFGKEEKLAIPDDKSLIVSQKVGYNKNVVLPCMFARPIHHIINRKVTSVIQLESLRV